MSDTIIDLIRHGEPQGGSLYRGHSIDDPLSDKGWQQMRYAVGNYNQWEHIISSPMLRCKAFSEEIAQKISIPLDIEENLKEVGFGSWEGFTREQIKQKNINEYNDFYSDPVKNRPDSFEDLNAFIKRVTTAYSKITRNYEGKNILLVAHAGVIRAILASIVEAPAKGLYKLKIANAGISRINASTGEIIFINNSL